MNRKLKYRGRKQAGRSPADTTAETSSASSAARRAVTWSCLGFLLPLLPAQWHRVQGTARCGFPYPTLTTPVGLFADLAWFVGGGKILKTKGWLKSPTMGLMALALFFNGLQRMTWIFAAWQLVGALCLVFGAKPFLRNLEKNQAVTVPVAGRGKTTMASLRVLSTTPSKRPRSSWPTPASHPAQRHCRRYLRQLLWLVLGMGPWASFPADWGSTAGSHPKGERSRLKSDAYMG